MNTTAGIKMEINDKIKEIQEAKKAYLKLIKSEGKGLVKQLLDNLFAEVPNLLEVKWNQYTPYFNDGDVCEFRIGDAGFKFAVDPSTPAPEPTEEDDEEYDDDDDDDFQYSYDMKDKKIKRICDQFSKTLTDLEEVLEITFGDHVEVFASTNKIHTKEYEHE